VVIVVSAVVAVAVVLALVAVMVWADRRDRAKGHVNRGFGDLGRTLRSDRENLRAIRRRGGQGVTPHQLRLAERRAAERRTR
jgi:hypothetical protein